MTLAIANSPSDKTQMINAIRQIILTAFLVLLSLATLEFVEYATSLGWSGLSGNAQGSRLISSSDAANLGIFLHMLTGAVITVLAPLQLIPVIRRKFPAVHRWSGRMLVGLATLTCLGGITYIVLHGTVGGTHMSIAFTIYGLLVLLCAFQTIRYARARDWQLHQDWALRMFFLAIASWLYRVHYAIWIPLTDSAAMTRQFTGTFDQFNLWAFYVPHLLILELVLFWRGRGLLRRAVTP